METTPQGPAGMSPRVELRSYPNATSYRHRHTYHQLLLPVTGSMQVATCIGTRHVSGDLTREPQPGTERGLVIPSGVPHDFVVHGPNRFVVVDLPDGRDERLFEWALREPSVSIDAATRHHVAALTERLAAAPLAATYRHHWTVLLLDTLQAPADAAAGRPDPLFERATRWIETHLDRPIGTADVARALGISVARVRALFRRQAGRTPRSWIATARLERAAALVEHSDQPLTAIALACGFSEQSALTRAFVRHFGEPPGHLRRRRERA